MKKTVDLTAGNAQLLYIAIGVHGFGKGLTCAEALKAYKKYNGYKPSRLAIYLCLEPLTEMEAFSEVQVEVSNVTYATDKVILLSQTEL
jgi:hypothetical protein